MQETLYEEVMETFGEKGEVDYDRVMKMPYLVSFDKRRTHSHHALQNAVFHEVLRLYCPAATFTSRRTIKVYGS